MESPLRWTRWRLTRTRPSSACWGCGRASPYSRRWPRCSPCPPRSWRCHPGTSWSSDLTENKEWEFEKYSYSVYPVGGHGTLSAGDDIVLTLNLRLEGIGVFTLSSEGGEYAVGLENTGSLSAGVVRHRLFGFLLQIPWKFPDKLTEKVGATVLAEISLVNHV